MKLVIIVDINKETLFPILIYNKPFQYNDQIILYPVKMKDIVLFQMLSQSITLRKNSVFHNKSIIKMSYLEFLFYCFQKKELEQEYAIDGLANYILLAIELIKLCCQDAKVTVDQRTGNLYINETLITPQVFDDLRRIIIIQNDIDFDVDDFLNYDTEKRLLKARNDISKTEEKANIEDYIDSLVIAMNTTEERIMNMTVRKFWRYIKRYQLHEGYTIAKTGECSGMISFKEPIKHWMVSLDESDKYKDLKADENSLKGKISQANN